jgi:hypothetical protein
MNMTLVTTTSGGHTFRLSLAFLLKRKKPAEDRPSATQTPKKIGKI